MSREVNNRVRMKDFTSNKIKMIAETDFIQKEPANLLKIFI